MQSFDAVVFSWKNNIHSNDVQILEFVCCFHLFHHESSEEFVHHFAYDIPLFMPKMVNLFNWMSKKVLNVEVNHHRHFISINEGMKAHRISQSISNKIEYDKHLH